MSESMDVAQVVLYAFWFFFFGLIFWLRREDRREGYPLENDKTRRVNPVTPVLIPPAKIFLLHGGEEALAPRFDRDAREMLAERISEASGAPLVPIGDPLLSGIGPASYAERADIVETTREGHDLIVPMRLAEGFAISAGPDPRGWNVVAADGAVAGTVTEVWVDRADVLVRYLEVALGAEQGTRLVPMPMALVRGDHKEIAVAALRAHQFASVPALRSPDRVTQYEEERIGAFYAGGRLYAEPRRAEPIL